MYKPTGFVPEIFFSAFFYSPHWSDVLLSHNIYKPDIFTFYLIAPTYNQAKEAEHFGPPK